MTTRPPHRYTAADDARILALAAMTKRDPVRRQDWHELAVALHVTTAALRSRLLKLHILDGSKPAKESIRKTDVIAPVVRPIGALLVDRPPWMAPITRERLMAGR